MNLCWPVAKLAFPLALVGAVTLGLLGHVSEGWGVVAGAGLGVLNVWLLSRTVRGLTIPGSHRLWWLLGGLMKFGVYALVLIGLFGPLRVSPWATCLGFTVVLAALGYLGVRSRVPRS